jgi:predicted transcriptional regulator
MKLIYNVQGKERKALVNIIAEAIDETAVYEQAPTYAYTIGTFTVTREGNLEFDAANTDQEQITAIIDALSEGGFEHDAADSLTISYPLEGFTPETIDNLGKMVTAKQAIIKKALGVDELPIQQGEDELSFPWLKGELTSEEIFAYSQFITQLCKTAQNKTRVTAKTQESFENEKFAMRVWLIGLGMIGSEFSTARKLMMKNLDGNSSWRYGDTDSENPRKERVHKEAISIRFTPEVLAQLSELASQHEGNISRNMLIESIVADYIQSETGAVDTTAPDTEGDDDGEEDE